jgi:hypothetical protein
MCLALARYYVWRTLHGEKRASEAYITVFEPQFIGEFLFCGSRHESIQRTLMRCVQHWLVTMSDEHCMGKRGPVRRISLSSNLSLLGNSFSVAQDTRVFREHKCDVSSTGWLLYLTNTGWGKEDQTSRSPDINPLQFFCGFFIKIRANSEKNNGLWHLPACLISECIQRISVKFDN